MSKTATPLTALSAMFALSACSPDKPPSEQEIVDALCSRAQNAPQFFQGLNAREIEYIEQTGPDGKITECELRSSPPYGTTQTFAQVTRGDGKHPSTIEYNNQITAAVCLINDNTTTSGTPLQLCEQQASRVEL